MTTTHLRFCDHRLERFRMKSRQSLFDTPRKASWQSRKQLRTF